MKKKKDITFDTTDPGKLALILLDIYNALVILAITSNNWNTTFSEAMDKLYFDMAGTKRKK